MNTNTTTPLTGGCACGAIRYQSSAPPVAMLNCHCRDCQRASGGPFSSFVVVLKDAFEFLQGKPRYHASPSERTGETHRGFCADCGSPIDVRPDGNPEIVAIRTASLDDPGIFQQQFAVWTSDAHAWDRLDPTLPSFAKYPPIPEEETATAP